MFGNEIGTGLDLDVGFGVGKRSYGEIDGERHTCLTSFLYTTRSAFGPSRVCFNQANNTEQITATSKVSRKTMKKTGTEKTFFVMLT